MAPYREFVLTIAGLCIAAFVVRGVMGAQRGRERELERESRRVRQHVGPALVDVTSIQIGIDWRARRFIQERLDELARGSSGSEERVRGRVLRGAAAALRGVPMSWVYAGVTNYQPMLEDSAEREFLKKAADARVAFQEEVVRVKHQVVQTLEPQQRVAKEHEGQGLVVVTLVVASRVELRDVDASDQPALDRLLAQLESLEPRNVVALEVLWSLTVEQDRMSSAELEARYPHLVRLASSHSVGRVSCAHCGGPHAAELRACPHCGAPTAAQT